MIWSSVCTTLFSFMLLPLRTMVSLAVAPLPTPPTTWFRTLQETYHVSPQTFVYREYLSSPGPIDMLANLTCVKITFYFQVDSIIFHYAGLMIPPDSSHSIHTMIPFSIDGRITPSKPSTTPSMDCLDGYIMTINAASPSSILRPELLPLFPSHEGTVCVLDWDVARNYLIMEMKWTPEHSRILGLSALSKSQTPSVLLDKLQNAKETSTFCFQ